MSTDLAQNNEQSIVDLVKSDFYALLYESFLSLFAASQSNSTSSRLTINVPFGFQNSGFSKFPFHSTPYKLKNDSYGAQFSLSRIYRSTNKTFPKILEQISDFFKDENRDNIILVVGKPGVFFKNLAIYSALNYESASKKSLIFNDDILNKLLDELVKRKICYISKSIKKGFYINLNLILTSDDFSAVILDITNSLFDEYSSFSKQIELIEIENSTYRNYIENWVKGVANLNKNYQHSLSQVNSQYTTINEQYHKINELENKIAEISITAANKAPAEPIKYPKQAITTWS